MAVSVTHSASSLLLEPLPNLDIPARRTVSHALHRVKFVGPLGQWTNFMTEVANTYNSQTWNPRETASRLTANFLAGSVHEEQVFVSDERGVQGRLEGRAGTALGAVFGAQNHDLKLGAFKGALPPWPGYKKTPDFVLMTSAHEAKIVGEAKVPWIREHNLKKLITGFESGAKQDDFRHVLGKSYELLIGINIH
jgi:hypothetical protein